MVDSPFNGRGPSVEGRAPSTSAAPADTIPADPRGTAAPERDVRGRVGSAIVSARMLSWRVDGARVVTTLGSDLIVGSAPLDEVELLLAVPEFKSTAYMMSLLGGGGELNLDLVGAEEVPDGTVLPAAKIGETILASRRWQEHRRRPPVATDRVWLLATLRPHGFGKDGLLALQAALTHQAIRAARCRVVGAPPEASWLARVDPGLMRRWLADARALLFGGGCHLLEPRGAWMRPPVVFGAAQHEEAPEAGVAPPAGPALPAQLSVKRGYRLAPQDLAAESGAPRRVLAWRGVRATALEKPDGSVIIEAGALFAVRPRSGVQSCIARKLERMQAAGLFVQTGNGVRQLTRPVEVSSLTNAFRLATISNLPGKGKWVPVA